MDDMDKSLVKTTLEKKVIGNQSFSSLQMELLQMIQLQLSFVGIRSIVIQLIL